MFHHFYGILKNLSHIQNFWCILYWNSFATRKWNQFRRLHNNKWKQFDFHTILKKIDYCYEMANEQVIRNIIFDYKIELKWWNEKNRRWSWNIFINRTIGKKYYTVNIGTTKKLFSITSEMLVIYLKYKSKNFPNALYRDGG